MLEEPSLLLRSWIHAPEALDPHGHARTGWVRMIVDPTTERSLGFAAWDDNAGLCAWLGRKRIQVFESEDESLLMTIQRPWSFTRTWTVLDAEDSRVAFVFHNTLYDRYMARLAIISIAADGTDSVLRREDGKDLATWQELAGQGRYFRFNETNASSPYVRMAALAGALALRPWPGDVSLAVKPV